MIEYVAKLSASFYECLDLIGHYIWIFFPFILIVAFVLTIIDMVKSL